MSSITILVVFAVVFISISKLIVSPTTGLTLDVADSLLTILMSDDCKETESTASSSSKGVPL